MASSDLSHTERTRADRSNEAVVAAVFRLATAVIAVELGLNPHTVLATDMSRQRPTPAWLAASRCQQLAIYVTQVELGLSNEVVARAAGRWKSAIWKALRKVEDRRDDPAIDALLDRVGAIVRRAA